MSDTQLELIKASRMEKQNEDKNLAKKMRLLDSAWEDFEEICKVANLKPILPDIGYTASIRDKLGFEVLNALQKYVVFFEGKNYNGKIPEEAFADLRVIDQYVLHIYQQKVYVETLLEKENKVRKLIDEVLLAEDLQAKDEELEKIRESIGENGSTIYVDIAILFMTIVNLIIQYVKWI